MADASPPEAGSGVNIRFLARLVTVLTATMIFGLLTIVALLVIRFADRAPAMPDRIVLPEGARAVAFTQGEAWFAVVTDDDRILIYDRLSGALLQSVELLKE